MSAFLRPQSRLPASGMGFLLCVGVFLGGGSLESLEAAGGRERDVTDQDRTHWAFLPLSDRVRARGSNSPGEAQSSSIDQFWALKTPAEPAAPVPRASKAVLLRRLSFGLTGLPPSLELMEAFERDPDPKAYERVVDRLLESRHYGEAWGRHWLDVARYADSNGYEDDDDRKWAWPYRDWVIRAFNADLPFDTFVQWQLAGDEFEPANADAVVATGFIAAALSDRHPPTITPENKLVYRYNELDDMVSTTGSAFLALTVGCSRCHDHKFDPIPTRDYYRMLAAFSTGRRSDSSLIKPVREFADWKAQKKRAYREEKMSALGLPEMERIRVRHSEFDSVFDANDLIRKHGEALEPKDETLKAWLSSGDQQIWAQLERAAADARKAKPDSGTALVFTDSQSMPMPEFLLKRGSVLAREEAVEFGVLQVLTRNRNPSQYLAGARPLGWMDPGSMAAVESGGFAIPHTTFQRKALATWITDPREGAGVLLARVLVNRLWQHHFGEGLVRTPSDFGTQGDVPSNPLLLDGLANQLIEGGWRLKPIQRLIVLSQVYQAASRSMASVAPDRRMVTPLSGDPRDLVRRPVRLEAEGLRDAMLAVSGKLNRKMFGPPFRIAIPKEAMATRSRSPYPTDIRDSSETSRRTVYAFVKRSVRNPMMEVFDAPDPSSACGRRNTTTVPTQALTLMNDAFVRECAVQFAQRIQSEVGLVPEAQVERAYRLALGRVPLAHERRRALDFLNQGRDARGEGIPVDGLTDLCHVLFTLNEFVYVE